MHPGEFKTPWVYGIKAELGAISSSSLSLIQEMPLATINTAEILAQTLITNFIKESLRK